MSPAVSTTRSSRIPRDFRLRLALPAALFAAGAIGLLARGGVAPHAPRWELLAAAPAVIRLHVAAATIALAIGVVLLAGVKGSRLHKALGWTWCAAMMTVAVSSLFIRVINPGHWSFIHFLSGWTIIAVPMGLVAIRRRNVRLHRRTMTGLFVGGLVIAGAFTFVPGRLMWSVFFGGRAVAEAAPAPL